MADLPTEPLASGPVAAVHSVSGLTRIVRELLEAEVGDVWVEGEVSNLRVQASGHQYFTLKDAGAQLSCVMFRGHARFLREPLRDGMSAQAFGGLGVYEARGQYQLVVRLVQPSGEGALQAKFEALKRRLDAEGLFDRSRKRPLPPFPEVLGLVTSPTGAALRDILQVLRRRAPWVRVLVAPARVQGDGAAAEIAAAIALLDHAADFGLPQPDTIIVGRGGGSIEDLWCFNEEVVARAIHACSTPVISAVGHEIDFTIADFAADVRAPTPSAAAELAVPDGTELRRHLAALGDSLRRRASTAVEHWQKVLGLTGAGAIARSAGRALAGHAQSLDQLSTVLDSALRQNLATLRTALASAASSVDSHRPGRQIEGRRTTLDHATHRLRRATESALRHARERHARATALLRTLGPGAVLARGFSMTLDPAGAPLTDPDAVRQGDVITTHLAKGTLTSRVE
jgi:exodeoxyribonuclease VII large subunit